jgi:hypothetical protein
MKYLLTFIVLLAGTGLAFSQSMPDSGLPQRDSGKQVVTVSPVKKERRISVADSSRRQPIQAPDSPAIRFGAGYLETLSENPWFNFFGQPQVRILDERRDDGRDVLFYLMAGLLLFFALIKQLFNRYVSNMLALVFRGSLRQKQIREQLMQTPLPALFLNIFFFLVAGLYVFLLIRYYGAVPNVPFWLLLLYCTGTITLVYLAKFIILKLTGWIFNMQEAADTYIFIVFLVNKLLAIFLLPMLIIITFSLAGWAKVFLTLSYVTVAGFFGYRYVVSFAPVRREVKVSQFHFFVYLCAFEIIPLLLIYKVLVQYF